MAQVRSRDLPESACVPATIPAESDIVAARRAQRRERPLILSPCTRSPIIFAPCE